MPADPTQNRPVRRQVIALLAGITPMVAVLGAYVLNIVAGGELEAKYICMPYLEGCTSISRAARSGPGLYLFRALMLPCTVLLVLCWRDVRQWLVASCGCSRERGRTVFWLGATGAVFLVLYVTALGTDGEWYKWLRRYGVTVYFGGTALAQLLLVSAIWPHREGLARHLLKPATSLLVLVSLQWILGLLSVLKRLILSDPDLVDRIENIIEWWFGLPMTLAFIVIAWLFRASAKQDQSLSKKYHHPAEHMSKPSE